MLFNRSRAIDYMTRFGLDALIATSPVNITYFTDYYCWLDPLFKEYMTKPGGSSSIAEMYAVFPREGEPAFVVSPTFAVNAAELWVRDLHLFGHPGLEGPLPSQTLSAFGHRLHELFHRPRQSARPRDALLSILRDRGLTKAVIGVEIEGMTAAARDALVTGLPQAQIKDCTNLIRLVRMVKSGEEIERLRRAAEISENAAMESLALARAGHPIADVVARYRLHVAEQGADFDHFAFGVNGLGIATEPSYILSSDDVLYVDFGCIYRHYFSDSGTTLAMVPLSGALQDRHSALDACFAAGTEAIRPGVLASSVQAAMREALSTRGVHASSPHGHGFGLEVRDYPILVADTGLRIRDDCVDVPSDLPLEANMVINLEAAVFLPGIGSVHREQTFVVTDNSSRSLIAQERARPVHPLAMN